MRFSPSLSVKRDTHQWFFNEPCFHVALQNTGTSFPDVCSDESQWQNLIGSLENVCLSSDSGLMKEYQIFNNTICDVSDECNSCQGHALLASKLAVVPGCPAPFPNDVTDTAWTQDCLITPQWPMELTCFQDAQKGSVQYPFVCQKQNEASQPSLNQALIYPTWNGTFSSGCDTTDHDTGILMNMLFKHMCEVDPSCKNCRDHQAEAAFNASQNPNCHPPVNLSGNLTFEYFEGCSANLANTLVYFTFPSILSSLLVFIFSFLFLV